MSDRREPSSWFNPPRCPNRSCGMHASPDPGFCRRRGYYSPKCRPEPVPRFDCRSCGRGFSRQTFRIDYRDHRPECNVRLFECLVSGVGLRQAGRIVKLGVNAVQHKFRKLARAMHSLNRNLLCHLRMDGGTFLLDEIETFEQTTILRLTVPVLMERSSYAILAINTAPIRRVPPAGCKRRLWLDRHEALHGPRQDRSAARLRNTFSLFRRILSRSQVCDGDREHGTFASQSPIELITDEKPLYASLLRSVIGAHVVHTTVNSTLPRTSYNPLFPVNLTDAMLRDNNGRLRRNSWLHTKKASRLRDQLELFVSYRNWHRRRTNWDKPGTTPGVVLGITERAYSIEELLAWRQDWRSRSIHPTSCDGSRVVGLGARATSA